MSFIPCTLSIDQLITAITALEPGLVSQCLRSDTRGIQCFKPLDQASITDWVFFNDPKWVRYLPSCQASGMVISQTHWELYSADIHCPNIIICPQPYVFFALAMQVLHSSSVNTKSVHYSNAVIHPSAQIGHNVSIADFVVIGANVSIGDNCVIHAHCSIAENVSLASDSLLYSHVTLYQGVILGRRCIVHAGAVIGSDGFGFAPYQKRWLKIPQIGTVIIADDVEIGANCTIDRGALGNTVIGRGTKLDNLIQIAHNVVIGEDCAFASGVGIAGSAVLGNRIQAGGKAGILGHLSICDDVVISSCTLVTKTINKPGFYTGVYPIQENAEWEKNAVILKRLFSMREQVKKLAKFIQ
jgi:UDP-3-O-[3-hydroxymyristoyl] glucosamine N-acyltransferase